MKMQKKRSVAGGAGRGMTVLELLFVVAIMATLMAFSLPHIQSIARSGKVGVATSQLRAISTALETHYSNKGAYPVDPGNVFGADIPEYLFAGLHHKSGDEGAGYDPEYRYMGFLNGVDDSDVSRDGDVLSADPMGKIEHSSGAFELKYRPRLRKGQSLVEAKGLPVMTDPWGNAYHYREWSSKRRDKSALAVAAGYGVDGCMNPESFDLWSNGPDGINNYGHPDSDDIVLGR